MMDCVFSGRLLLGAIALLILLILAVSVVVLLVCSARSGKGAAINSTWPEHIRKRVDRANRRQEQ